MARLAAGCSQVHCTLPARRRVQPPFLLFFKYSFGTLQVVILEVFCILLFPSLLPKLHLLFIVQPWIVVFCILVLCSHGVLFSLLKPGPHDHTLECRHVVVVRLAFFFTDALPLGSLLFEATTIKSLCR